MSVAHTKRTGGVIEEAGSFWDPAEGVITKCSLLYEDHGRALKHLLRNSQGAGEARPSSLAKAVYHLLKP